MMAEEVQHMEYLIFVVVVFLLAWAVDTFPILEKWFRLLVVVLAGIGLVYLMGAGRPGDPGPPGPG